MKGFLDSFRFKPQHVPATRMPGGKRRRVSGLTANVCKKETSKRKQVTDREGVCKVKVETELGHVPGLRKVCKKETTKKEQDKAWESACKVKVETELDRVPVQAFVAPSPARYRERYASVCQKCFESSVLCMHFEEEPLELLLVGHNPSEHAWSSGFFYSNPTNRMWKLLTGVSLGKGSEPFVSILPQESTIEDQNILPSEYHVGLTDVGLEPGSNASTFGKAHIMKWSKSFFARLEAHTQRAGAPPVFIAFAGKRQLQMLFQSRPPKVEFGEYLHTLPDGWPFQRSETKVWVLPSSSGRAAMSHATRSAPYRDLAAAIALHRSTHQTG
mmetsp:Transcript_12778/g.20666  ORF Transcript_12778/g.20666 Transcript_12778/m.20666 type:complete len:329 (-) Transcript_12778:2028-3014(-)|eukprot:CAMPEP_0203751658 /NCGR_PEP_ID=MMETSP0098-20131031/5698_1 /ASSEMBLY_ACC=CAM_ASM_000208 /TAXON_ID=96639 /ORGANISM=" , Strain NY0313808BC1" /LENGTH=328 /DNA_ID=CAMNT_0050641479 /DNA_START=152 /DNA_END=1138 /DNA_ORIENTATION=+